MKKLVPAIRSSSSRIPPPSKTGNDKSASTAVVNHAQLVSGMRISDMPFVRMLRSVVMKFSAPSKRADAEDRDTDYPRGSSRRPGPVRRSCRGRSAARNRSSHQLVRQYRCRQ